MLDMGFWPNVKFIVSQLPAERPRQTLLFSATMPEEVMGFALDDHGVAHGCAARHPQCTRDSITHKAELLGRREKPAWSRASSARTRSNLVFRLTDGRRPIGLARDLQSQGIRAARPACRRPGRRCERSRASIPAPTGSSSPGHRAPRPPTSTPSRPSSTSRCRSTVRRTCTASGVLAGRIDGHGNHPWYRPTSGTTWKRSLTPSDWCCSRMHTPSSSKLAKWSTVQLRSRRRPQRSRRRPSGLDDHGRDAPEPPRPGRRRRSRGCAGSALAAR